MLWISHAGAIARGHAEVDLRGAAEFHFADEDGALVLGRGDRGDGSVRLRVHPNGPVEWGAPGIDLDVAWLRRSSIRATGNSFAAPQIAGLIALILSKHPGLTPFQVKTILAACAANASIR